jgi:hypothetical protein
MLLEWRFITEELQADREKRRRIEDELRDPKNFVE